MSSPNDFEQTARERKAYALCFAIERAIGRQFSDPDSIVASEVVKRFDDTAWDLATQAAKVNPPSDKTKRLVVELFAAREGDAQVPAPTGEGASPSEVLV